MWSKSSIYSGYSGRINFSSIAKRGRDRDDRDDLFAFFVACDTMVARAPAHAKSKHGTQRWSPPDPSAGMHRV